MTPYQEQLLGIVLHLLLWGAMILLCIRLLRAARRDPTAGLFDRGVPAAALLGSAFFFCAALCAAAGHV